MQGIEKITEKIISDAKEKAADITTAAYTQAAAIVKDAADSAITERTKKRAIGDEERKREEERTVSSANMSAKKQVLEAKQVLVEKTFERALKKLLELPDAEYEAVLVDLIARVSETGSETVVLSDKDKSRVSASFIADVNSKLKAQGKKADITLSDGTVDICGGFVLKRGNIELNNAFDALLKQGKQDLELQVAEILFLS